MADGFTVSASGKATIVKDPDATLDYSLDWSAWLGTDTVSSLTIVADTGLTVVSHTINYTAAVAANPSAVPPVLAAPASTITTAFISGGTAGKTFAVTFRIVTAGGRTEDRTIYLKIKDR